MSAFSSLRAGCLPALISAFSRSRSSALSLTTYFFVEISCPVTNRLRRCQAIDSKGERRVNDAGYWYLVTVILPG